MREIKSSTVKIYLWFIGLSNDLIFYIAINSIWLAGFKGLSALEITSLTSISGLLAVLLQYPVLYIMRRISAIQAVRLAAIFLVLSSLAYLHLLQLPNQSFV